MANKVIIDIEARLIDRVSGDAKKVEKNIDNLEKKAEKAKKSLNDLGKTKAKPTVEANTSKFEKAMNKAAGKLDKFSKMRASAVLDALDKASPKFQKVHNKFKEFGGKTYRSILSVHDSNAMSTIKKVASAGRSIAGATWRATVSIADMATSPLRRIKDSLFSIKGLVTAITAGFATQQMVFKPISAADAYSGALIGFSNLLGGESQGQAMMDDLDQFAKKTPFNTTNVISNAQKMMAMGWDAENILTDMEIIGNAAAATGKLDVGLESIVRAMSQIKTKGKLSTEELNQLAEAGIAAKAMLAEELGYGTGDKGIAAMTADLESGNIGSDTAIDALLRGMQKYDGMMESMANETAEGLISQLKDVFEINIVRKWGQGLQDGAKKGLGSILELLDKSEDGLAKVGDMLFELGSDISNKAAKGLDKVIQKILAITETDEFKNADIGEKIHIMWDQVVAEPLADWWESTGRAKVASIAEKIGSGLGEGIGNVFKGLFGVADDVGGGAVTVGSSFAKGFLDGFDAKGVANAIFESFKSFFKEHPIAGTLLGAHMLNRALSPFGGTMAVAGAGRAALRGAGGLTGIIGSTGNAMVAGSGLSGLLASAGYALTGGAATSALTGGAAALVGGGSILGGLAGLLGIGSGVKDLIKGDKLKGGTKLGLVGAGAGIGTAIMPGVGTLIGGGIGGLAALLGGDAISSALSNLGETLTTFFTETLPEKWNSFWDGVGSFFTEKVPYAIGYAAGATVRFFTETLPEKWDSFWDGVGTFFTETLPTWASDVWTNNIYPFFTEDIPSFFSNLWDNVSTFVTEGIPTIASDIWGSVSSFFTETVPGWFHSVWDNLKAGFSAGSGGGGGGSSPGKKATGGLIQGRQLSWLGEEGTPEMVIPLGANRRNRGLELWAQAARYLGVRGFAGGGIAGGVPRQASPVSAVGPQGGGAVFNVNIGGVTLEVNVSEGNGILDAIAEQKEKIAEEVAGIINRALETQYQNMPVRGGA